MQGPGAPGEDTANGFDRGGWLVPHTDEDFGRIVDGWFSEADEILLGRKTYQDMQAFWTQITDPDEAVAVALNGLPKHVVSTTLAEATWNNSSLISADVVGAVSALKAKPGRELQVHGSWQLARTLHDAGLVDEYRLLVAPVVVGAGKRLFADGATPSGFTLVESEVTSVGAVHLVLRPTAFATGGVTVEDGTVLLGTTE